MSANNPRFWVGVASREHVLAAVDGGFCQFSHGSAAALARVRPGDSIAYYSPRSQMRGGRVIQAFTAIGIVGDGEVQHVSQSGGFRPSRRPVKYAVALEAPIKPLLASLSFTRDRADWGLALRRGLFSMSSDDLVLISNAMRVREIDE